MNREGPTGTLPCAQMLACGRPEANLILHVCPPAKVAVERPVIDVNNEDAPAVRRAPRGRRDILADPIERVERVDVSRGLDAVAQEHVHVLASLRSTVVPVELEMPRGRVARVDLLERHVEDRLRRM